MTNSVFTREGKITNYALAQVLAFINGRLFDEETLKEVAERLSVPMTTEGLRYGMYVYINIKL